MIKKDIKLGLVIGFLIGLLALPTLKNLEQDILSKWQGFKFAYFFLLPIILPLLVMAGLFIADKLAKKIKVIWQLARFVLVGALNTFIDFGVLGFLLWVSKIDAGQTIALYAFFKFLSFSFASINSYFWNRSWTFEKGGKAEGKEFAGFYLITGVGALLNVGIASLIVSMVGSGTAVSGNVLAGIIAPFAGVLIGFIWNFLGYKFFIFKK
ncbi:GtrA family protein [Patescibacteria group bacterium]|nr:GtrA family protein [Patescibacteria group bacterium]MBU4162108.1 GtrA family protein [Patescibacteria group bacterium]